MPDCSHCGGEMRGYASVDEHVLCHPDDGLDCYRLVSVYGHQMPCRGCHDVRVLEDRQRREWGSE